ncbi:MAG: thioesterase domain-containing protein, partial [Roseiarcus sp.]
RAALERQLPRHMAPSSFVWLDAMPMTPNGKLDRKALPAPPREETGPAADHPPETPLEREIAGIWEDVLRLPPLGVRADFFESGGDSLALLSLFAAVETRFGRRLTVDVLTGGLTIARLVRLLDGDEQSRAPMDPVVALQPLGHRSPFFCVHGIGGDVLHLHRLAARMGTNRPFFGLRRTSEPCVTETISQMSARYVAAMLSRQPARPFYLGGHSFGAMVAYEMARQLTEQGHEIGLLAIIDARTPGWRPTPRDALPALYRVLADLPGRFHAEMGKFETASRFREGRRMLRRWLKAAFGVQPDAASMFDLSRFGPDQILMFDANLRALHDYRPAPSALPITLFRASEPLPADLIRGPTLGWASLSKGDVTVHIVPGDHHSITTEPLVGQLAAALSRALDASQGA